MPLDPELPPQRLAFILADGPVRLVLTQRSRQKRLEAAGVPLLCLDEAADLVRRAEPGRTSLLDRC